MLFTVGYEGENLDAFLAKLQAAKVDRVIDIRAMPLSRKKGFSKTPLGAALADIGIEYVHIRAAGNPYRKEDDLLVKYKMHLASTPEAVEEVAEAARGHRAALLCFEADPTTCHRSILAPPVAKLLGASIKNL